MKTRFFDSRALLPSDEIGRLEDLRALNVLDTPREYVYDTLVALAAALFDAPMAALSLVDADHLWLKAEIGLDERQYSRKGSFCAQAILGSDVLVVPDARLDPRFWALSTGADRDRALFYAGVPLTTYRGHRVGTLCVMDWAPRDPASDRLRLLEGLGGIAMHAMEAAR